MNQANIDVVVGTGTSAGHCNNTFNGGQTLTKEFDAPTADAAEFHNQTTHIGYTADNTGGGLELRFDFGVEYDINTLHFCNYAAESNGI